MTTTLTERYIDAAIRSIPPASRDDVQAELEVSIVDAIDARTEQGEDRTAAERAVLSSMGDPGILAAGYAERPLHLIGPRFYLTWWRLLKLLWAIIPPVSMAGVALAKALAGASVGEIYGSAFSVGLAVFVHVAFWVTLVFVVLERTGNTGAVPKWSVDQLQEIRPKGPGRADMIAALVLLVLGVAALLFDKFGGFVRIGSGAFPVLNPGLWPWWITGLAAIMAAKTALVIAVYRTGRWNVLHAVINTALALVFTISAVSLLAAGQLVNPELIVVALTNNGVDADTVRTLTIITSAAIIGFGVWDIIDSWLKTLRDNRRRASESAS